jgi:RNA polymerase sigma-70 factor (ECF subfamily)
MSDVPAPPGDEAWLVLRAQAGSREHLERLVALAQDFLGERLKRLFDEPADAEDVLQDVLFVICRRLWTLNDARLFRPWAHRIGMRAAWKAINRQRRDQKREESIDIDSLPDEVDSPSGVDLQALLRTVSPASRVVLSLHYLEGFTLEATAAELGVAPGTVKSRLAYGLKQLREAQSASR